jgi:hypothetical protein
MKVELKFRNLKSQSEIRAKQKRKLLAYAPPTKSVRTASLWLKARSARKRKRDERSEAR